MNGNSLTENLKSIKLPDITEMMGNNDSEDEELDWIDIKAQDKKCFVWNNRNVRLQQI